MRSTRPRVVRSAFEKSSATYGVVLSMMEWNCSFFGNLARVWVVGGASGVSQKDEVSVLRRMLT